MSSNGYLPEVRCRWFAYGPSDVTAAHHFLLIIIQSCLRFWCRLT